MMPEVVAVSGASGFVGRHVVGELLDRGVRVQGLVRSVERAGQVLPSDHERLMLVPGEGLGDADAVAEVLDGAGAVVNTVGIIREAPGGQTFERVHVQGTRALVEACRRAGVRRFVQISALGVRDEAPTEYFRSKHRAERLVRESGLDWTILRPGMIHGVGSGFLEMAKGWVTGKATPHLFVPYFQRHAGGPPIPGLARLEDPSIQPVAVEDVAWAACECLGRERAVGEVYHLVGPEVTTMPEVLRTLRRCIALAKANHPLVPIPHTVGVAVARVGRALGLQYALPFDAGMAAMASEDGTAPLDKAREHLGFSPRPCLSTMCEYAPRL